MVEAYAFLAAFALQILATSVLYPALFVRFVRARTKTLPLDRLAQMYPGIDVSRPTERVLNRYRALNAVIALLGLLLLAWLFTYVQRADWHDGPVKVLITVYFLAAQMLPLALIAWLGAKFNREHQQPLPLSKRTAVLQRRGLFDFISPFAVGLAVVSYFLFVAFVLFYIRQHPVEGFPATFNIVGITLLYMFIALVVYVMLYGKTRNPLETHAGRLQAIGVTVKSGVYTCIVTVMFVSFNFASRLLDLQRWELFALSVFFVVCALVSSMGVARRPAAT